MGSFLSLLETQEEIHRKKINQCISSCYIGNLNEVKQFIQEGVCVNETNSMNEFPLGIACKNGHLELVKYLIEGANANIHLKNDMALELACEYGHLNIIKYLIQNQNSNDYQNHHHMLVIACQYGHLQVVKYLIEEVGLDPHTGNEITLLIAVRRGYLEIVKYLIEETGANPHVENDYPFILACVYGHYQIVKYFTNHFHIDTITLHYALHSIYWNYIQNLRIISHLLDKGAILCDKILVIRENQEYIPVNPRKRFLL
jgi:ankyrin repeat protein